MIYVSRLIIPVITLVVIIYAIIKKVNIYDEFLDGVREGLKLSLEIFPSMFAMIVSVSVLVKSNVLYDLVSGINTRIFPSEILPIAILRPISSSSSIMILNDILKVHGVDSVIGKMAAIITGSTDTTIYIIGMYYSSIKVKKIKHSLLVGLMADLACVVISVIIINLF